MLTVALHGHLSAQFGLAGGATASQRLLEAIGCTVVPRDLRLATHPSDTDLASRIAASALEPCSCQVDLVHTNPNLLAANPELLNPSQLTAPLRIGYWAWELEAFPEGWEPFFADYDEIWCPSPFSAQALIQRSPIPVVSVPHLPDWPRLDGLRLRRQQQAQQQRSCNGPSPQRPFRVLSLFDFWSTTERKNPLGSIAAFQRAFPADHWQGPPVELVIKTSSAEQFPHDCQQLIDLAANDPRIHWLHERLSPTALDDLLLSADVLLSLHRSEGFGLVLADAMAIELPVIATGYSGNLEYMPSGSAALVPWHPQVIKHTCGDYRLGWIWAEPDPQAAATVLRQLVLEPEAAAALGRAAAEAIRERLSVARLGAIVRQRLGTLLLKPSRRELRADQGRALRVLG